MRPSPSSAVLAALTLLTVACSSTGPHIGGGPPAQELMAPLMEEHHVPGVALALVRDGRIAWTRAYGVQDARSGVPVTPTTVFEAASLSKPVFAAAVLELARVGVLQLAESLDRWLPDMPAARGVTVRHALTHTAGLPNWADDGSPPSPVPGSDWSYSGEGYVLLQRAMEAATGRSWTVVVDSLVLSPLRMASSSYRWSGVDPSRVATGHDSRGIPAPKWQPDDDDVRRRGAATTLHATVEDLARFLAHLSAHDEALDGILDPAVPVDLALGLSWGLGWAVEEHPEEGRFAFHWGANPHFRSFMILSERDRYGLVILTNGTEGLEMADEIVEAVTGVRHPLFRFYMLHPTD